MIDNCSSCLRLDNDVGRRLVHIRTRVESVKDNDFSTIIDEFLQIVELLNDWKTILKQRQYLIHYVNKNDEDSLRVEYMEASKTQISIMRHCSELLTL